MPRVGKVPADTRGWCRCGQYGGPDDPKGPFGMATHRRRKKFPECALEPYWFDEAGNIVEPRDAVAATAAAAEESEPTDDEIEEAEEPAPTADFASIFGDQAPPPRPPTNGNGHTPPGDAPPPGGMPPPGKGSFPAPVPEPPGQPVPASVLMTLTVKVTIKTVMWYQLARQTGAFHGTIDEWIDALAEDHHEGCLDMDISAVPRSAMMMEV